MRSCQVMVGVGPWWVGVGCVGLGFGGSLGSAVRFV